MTIPYGTYKYGKWTYGGDFIDPTNGLPAFSLKYKESMAYDFALIRCYGDRFAVIENGIETLSLPYLDYPYMGDIAAGLKDKFEFQFQPGQEIIDIAGEVHMIPSLPSQVQLSYLPKQGTLYITSMTEVTYTPSPGQYWVDYSTGIITFNPADEGGVFSVNYQGVIAVPYLTDVESKYLCIKWNWNKRVTKPVFTDITYQQTIVTVADVLQEIPGVQLSFAGSEIDHRRIEQQIEQEVKHIENKTRLFLKETVIKCDLNPYSIVNQVGITCDMLEPPYDGTDTNYLKLRYEPMISVQRVELVYLGNLVRSYPFEWIQLNKFRSEVRIVPKTGSFHLMGMYSGSYLFHSFFPRTTSMFGHFLPWIQIDYTAGWTWGDLPVDLKLAVTKGVAAWILSAADGLMMPGVASKSQDGVSESYTRNAQSGLYGYRRKELKEEIAELLKPWLRVRFVVP